MRCAIFGCNSNNKARIKKGDLSFFSFPKDKNIRKTWIIACCRSDDMNIETSRICSKHFKLDDFILLSFGQGRLRLKNGTTPTLFLPTKMPTRNKKYSQSPNVNVLLDGENDDFKCNFTSNEVSTPKSNEANFFTENTQPVQIQSTFTIRILNSDEVDDLNEENDKDLQAVDDQLLMTNNGPQISKINQELKIPRSQNQCGVPQCRIRRNANRPSMFRIPNYIRNSPTLLTKWSRILQIEKPFSKHFAICSLHFEKNQIITPKNQGDKMLQPILKQNAVPSLHLPKPKNVDKRIPKQPLETASCATSKRSRCEAEKNQPICKEFVNETNVLSSLCDTDEKLNVMTGLNDKSSLDRLISNSLKLRKRDSIHMSMRDRIILTMCKLKTNLDFEQLGVLFKINNKTAENFFADTIKHLAEILRPLIFWPSKEKKFNNLPQHLKNLSNVRIIVECIEISMHPQLSVLIGIDPSGLIIYVSNVFNGFISNRNMFNQTELLKLLKPNDVVMIDSDFYIQDENSIGGIKMVALNGDLEQNRICAAKIDIETRIEKLKKFKILSETVDESLLPLIKDIMIVLCGLSNVYLNKS